MVPALPGNDSYNPTEPAEAARLGFLADARAEGEGSLRRLRPGWRLGRMERDGLYRDWAFDTLRDFVTDAQQRGESAFGWDQAQSYLRIARLPAEPLAGTDLSLKKLELLVPFHEHGEDLRPLALQLAEGRRLPGQKGGRGPAEDKPFLLARRAARALRALTVLLAVLFQRTDGRALVHSWALELDGLMESLVRAYAAWRGLSPEALWPERRRTERAEEGSGAAAPTAEKPRQDGTLHGHPEGTGEGPREGAAGVVEGAAAPGEAAADWHGPLCRAVVAHLQEEEPPLLSQQLQLCLSGRPPRDLIAFLRAVGGRMSAAAPREDLAQWLKHVGAQDLEARWPYLFNFFAAAQLPGFRHQLHSLRTVDLPAAAKEVLAAAWDFWPLGLPSDEPSERGEEAARAAPPKEVMEADRLLRQFLAEKREANAEVMSWAWQEAFGLREELLGLFGEMR